MTDSVQVEEEENRLRERLRAKSQMRREQDTRASSSERDPDRHDERVPNRRFHGDRRGMDDYHRGGGRGRDRYHSYDERDRHMSNRDGRRRRDDFYGRGRGPPGPPHPHDFPPSGDRRRPYGDDPYYPPPGRGPSGRRDGRGEDRYGRTLDGGRSPSSHRYRDRQRSLSRSRSNSYDDDSSRSGCRGRGRYRHHRSSRRSRSRSRSISPSESESESESSQSSVESPKESNPDGSSNVYTKDQRTVFVTQLVQRTVEKDIKKYFAKNNLKVNEVILLRDKRTGRHKGCAYVELRRMEDVSKSVGLSNVAPSFQRFPILIKASEAEKNYVAGSATTALTATQMGQKIPPGPLLDPNGKLLEAQKVYVGSLDPSVTQGHLFVLFSQFGQLEKVSLQVDSASGLSKGFAFLSFRDPKEANLAIQTMGNQVLAGRPMKTGWAVNQISSIPGAEVVTSDEFPPDASARATNAYKVLGQLTMGVPVSQIGHTAPVVANAPSNAVSRVPTVAEARASLVASGPIAVAADPVAQVPALPETDDPAKVGNADSPTNHILVHNMFDKDQETEPGWESDIKEEFEEECSKFGKITKIKVISTEPGGKIFASFDTIQGAQSCASSLAGRWFDKRRLQVEFVQEGAVPE